MPDHALRRAAEQAVGSIEQINTKIDGTFAEVGAKLGRGQAIFLHLNQGLTRLSEELSGTNMEGASVAFQDIAKNLTLLANALPAESRLLGTIGAKAADASVLLKRLLKHIQMISIIARSARIEAASLDGHRESFLNFTQEAFNLARSVLASVKECARDQAHLVAAIELALGKQHEFEGRYRQELLAVGADMANSYRGLQDQQADAANLAAAASASADRIAQSIGISIVSLQAGDSMRQRLEHICDGLRMVAADTAPLVPEDAGATTVSDLVGRLEADQLQDAIREFEAEIGQIGQALSALLSNVADIVKQGRALYGGGGDDRSSFLSALKQSLSQASRLIATCERARRSVDEALSVVEQTLGRFRNAVSELSQTVIDIILIGMNAGLRAGHLGAKGASFVVIANELKTTADQISSGTDLLKPLLDDIEMSAGELRKVRAAADSSQLAKLEPSILKTVGEVEAGNERLDQVMRQLAEEGVEFEGLGASAQTLLTSLSAQSSTLPPIIGALRAASGSGGVPSSAAEDAARTLDALYARYTMSAEREVHRRILRQAGMQSAVLVDAPSSQPQAADDDVMFF